ncbi:hypothetical protein LEP1GSC062_2776 [Leptospira alexanderi serovar Manhao 3 str. L 60]|uniref:Uncharacterized protein n=1 Tax=Leptospira alexanderi serovar Manhao 3 str. L 60 TaxID=1049759 RepID=V6I9F8_9LEPT|nr:hypothetical protein LEP1GSC062_2776 [Leptospira alexanderi serovar Manhao 3 str. L 60]
MKLKTKYRITFLSCNLLTEAESAVRPLQAKAGFALFS